MLCVAVLCCNDMVYDESQDAGNTSVVMGCVAILWCVEAVCCSLAVCCGKGCCCAGAAARQSAVLAVAGQRAADSRQCSFSAAAAR